jgi:hypothetical protein
MDCQSDWSRQYVECCDWYAACAVQMSSTSLGLSHMALPKVRVHFCWDMLGATLDGVGWGGMLIG